MVVTLLEPVSCLSWREFTVPDQKPLFVAEVELQRGDALVIHYENSPLVNDQGNNRAKHIARVSGQLIDMFATILNLELLG